MILSESLEPKRIQQAVDLEPDKSWKRGDVRKPTLLRERENGWLLESKNVLEYDLEEHLSYIKKTIGGREKVIKELMENQGCEIQVSCVFYCKTPPELNIRNELVTWLSIIGASLDIDVNIK